MSRCPGIDTLEAGGPAIAEHLALCPACRSIAELMQVSGPAPEGGDCARAELLIAAGAGSPLGAEDASFLPAHLRRCPACRETALEPPVGDLQPPAPAGPGQYLVGAEIGRGGMGRVMAARDLRIGRAVALKEMLATDPQARARFEREARITAQLQHPGIVSIYEVGRWPDGRPYYAMPILPGRTLGQEIAAARDLRQRLHLVPALIAAADAVAYAHNQHIIHRDLTPANILLGSFGETIVIDWGVAKQLQIDGDNDNDGDPAPQPNGTPAAHAPGLTVQGTVIGTPPYIAPEQAAGRPVDARADVYALGAILYQLLTGAPPYAGSSGEVIDQLREGRPPAPIGKRAPRDLRSIAEKAMALDPAARYPSARQLVDELRRYQLGERVAAHRYTRRELAGRWLGRRLPVVAVASVLLTLLAVTAGMGGARLLRERRRAEASSLELEKVREMLGANKATTGTGPIKGWYATGTNPQNFDMAVDRTVTWQGRPSARLRAIDARTGGFGSLAQMFDADAYRGKRVRLSAVVKSEGLTDWAALWLRIDGPSGEHIAIDNMNDRLIRGTTDWQRHQLVLDVPQRARYLVIGLMMNGAGTAWASDLKFEVVDDSVAVTVADRFGAPAPRNLDFSGPWADHPHTSPPGWERFTEQPDHFRVSLAPNAHGDGKPAVQVRSTAVPGVQFMLAQMAGTQSFRGKRLRVSALVRTEDVASWARLFARLEGGEDYLIVDQMDERPLTGTSAWQRHEIVIDVPEDALLLVFGATLDGPGYLALADFRVEVVDATVPLTSTRPLAPRNLDLSQ